MTRTPHIITLAFFATFTWQGTQEPVGPAIYGGPTKAICESYADDLRSRIKRGQGKQYRPIDFKCEGRQG